MKASLLDKAQQGPRKSSTSRPADVENQMNANHEFAKSVWGYLKFNPNLRKSKVDL